MSGKQTRSGRSWSVARGARAVREARLATAAHMREAEIAREWQRTMVDYAYRQKLAHLGQPRAAWALLCSGVGYGEPFPADAGGLAYRQLRDEARYLSAAQLYVLSPAMCDVAVAAAQTLSMEDLSLLSEQDVPGPTGLVSQTKTPAARLRVERPRESLGDQGRPADHPITGWCPQTVGKRDTRQEALASPQCDCQQ